MINLDKVSSAYTFLSKPVLRVAEGFWAMQKRKEIEHN